MNRIINTPSWAIRVGILSAAITCLPAWAYTVSITEPAESRAYHRPAQSIDVAVQVRPNLTDDMSVHLLVGDVNLGVGASGSLPTVDLNPGEHLIKAIVMDKNGNQVASAERTIYVIQNTNITRARRAAQVEYDKYQSLPWYQKLYLNLHQGFEPPKNPSAPPSVNPQ